MDAKNNITVKIRSVYVKIRSVYDYLNVLKFLHSEVPHEELRINMIEAIMEEMEDHEEEWIINMIMEEIGYDDKKMENIRESLDKMCKLVHFLEIIEGEIEDIQKPECELAAKEKMVELINKEDAIKSIKCYYEAFVRPF
jgi:hypothetical protein